MQRGYESVRRGGERECQERGRRWTRGGERRGSCLPVLWFFPFTSLHLPLAPLLLPLMDGSEIRGPEWKLSRERKREIHLSPNEIFAVHSGRERKRKTEIPRKRQERKTHTDSMANWHGLPGLPPLLQSHYLLYQMQMQTQEQHLPTVLFKVYINVKNFNLRSNVETQPKTLQKLFSFVLKSFNQVRLRRRELVVHLYANELQSVTAH